MIKKRVQEEEQAKPSPCICGHEQQDHWVDFDESELEEFFRCQLCICREYKPAE